MTKEDKDLLLKDLCARLPYGVKVKITSKESKNRIVHLTEDNICHLTDDWWSEYKPYLFPLSSMTEEQKKEYNYITERWMYDSSYSISDSIDWLNANNFDYRGLIPKGLANDATGLNIY